MRKPLHLYDSSHVLAYKGFRKYWFNLFPQTLMKSMDKVIVSIKVNVDNGAQIECS